MCFLNFNENLSEARGGMSETVIHIHLKNVLILTGNTLCACLLLIERVPSYCMIDKIINLWVQSWSLASSV